MNAQRNDFTYSLLLNAGIKPNMRVLDVGCGFGEVTMLISKLIGNNGEVIGFDMNESSIETCKKTFADRKISNASFLLAEIEKLPKDIGEFDAIVGRRVLMYQKNAVNSVKSLTHHLSPGGIMIFQESDSMGTKLIDKSLKLHEKYQRYIWDTVEKEGGDIHMGLNLYQTLKEAGLIIKGIKSELILQTIETGSDLSFVVKMMIDRIKKAKVATFEEINIDTLETDLKNELIKSKVPFIRDIAFGAWAALKN